MKSLFELVDLWSALGDTVWYYPGATEWAGESGMLLRLSNSDGTTWLAMVGGPADGQHSMPDGKRVYTRGLVLNPENHHEWHYFSLDMLNIQIGCPNCSNEMIADSDSISLAEGPNGAMLECGQCEEISQWRFNRDPFSIEQVIPITWGGKV